MDLEDLEYVMGSLKLLGSKGTTGTQASFLELFNGDQETIDKRIKRAEEELEYLPEYDYLVINDTVEQAVEDVDCIVKAERMKCSRNPELKNKFKGDALK